MKTNYRTLSAAVVGLVVCLPAWADEPQGVEVLARGPLHEAFAQPVEAQPLPAPVVPRQPPDPITELPPAQKPEGDNVQWIPGYWSWDDEQKDFLWVSGFWRVPPPDRQWLPGHWQQVANGWQWAPGFWTPLEQATIEFKPAPPAPVNAAPAVPAPTETSVFVPGTWIYLSNQYRWRPGFWIPFRPGWVWIPAYYFWTPGGYVFVEGYWDHPLLERGLLFAPIRFTRPLVLRLSWVFTPRYVVQPDFMVGALFVRPGRAHYYFGDYFGPRYAGFGYVSWVDYRASRFNLDPNFSYYHYQYVKDPFWERNLRTFYSARARGEIARPPRTLVQQTQVVQNVQVNKTANVNVHNSLRITHAQNVTALAPLAEVHNTRVTALGSLGQGKGPTVSHVTTLEQVTREQRVQEQKAAVQIRESGHQRAQVEAKLITPGKPPPRSVDVPRSVKVDLPRRTETVTPRPGGKGPPPPPPASPKVEERVGPKK
jgi:YXWGXW repeat-containing protein